MKKLLDKKTSQKKIDANRLNASRSTGPQTGAGKRISSQNALQHGLSVPAYSFSPTRSFLERLYVILYVEQQNECKLQMKPLDSDDSIISEPIKNKSKTSDNNTIPESVANTHERTVLYKTEHDSLLVKDQNDHIGATRDDISSSVLISFDKLDFESEPLMKFCCAIIDFQRLRHARHAATRRFLEASNKSEAIYGLRRLLRYSKRFNYYRK